MPAGSSCISVVQLRWLHVRLDDSSISFLRVQYLMSVLRFAHLFRSRSQNVLGFTSTEAQVEQQARILFEKNPVDKIRTIEIATR
jgi:hypothetical protein